MMIYIMILLIFIYFKIARVHYKEEKLTLLWKIQHIIVAITAVSTYIYAFTHISWYLILIVSFLSFLASAMLITAIQLGIFVDGKPLFGMDKVYKNTIFITLFLICLSVIIYI